MLGLTLGWAVVAVLWQAVGARVCGVLLSKPAYAVRPDLPPATCPYLPLHATAHAAPPTDGTSCCPPPSSHLPFPSPHTSLQLPLPPCASPPHRDKLLAEAARWVPSLSVDPWFRLVGNTSSPAEADAQPAAQVNTGLEDLARVWQVEEWQHVREVRCWGEGHVERVRGTDAFQFSPGLQLNDTVEAWVGELYRAARLIANEQVSLEGVPLLRMRADMSQADPDPRFFQTIRGLMNLTTPMAAGPSGLPGAPGPPIFLSYPHFCGADPVLAQGVVGLRCLPEYHDLFLDVEPNTGITLRAAKRLMMVSWFGGKWGVIDGAARDTFLPIFWAEEGSTAGAEQLQAFAPLLRARAAEAALRRWAFPAACAAALASVAALCAACVLWSDDSRGSGASSSTEAAAGGYARLENGEGEAPALGWRGDHEQQSGEPPGVPEAAEEPQQLPEEPQEVPEQRREPSSHPVTPDAEHEQEGS